MPDITDYPEDEQSSLLPDKIPSSKFERIPLERLKRLKLDGPEPSAAFIETVRNYGILEPILVLRTDKDKITLRDGIRRVKAAFYTGLAKVPAMVFTDETTLRNAITLIANTHRSKNPLAELRAIRELTKKKVGISEIVEITGISKARIYQRLALENLPDVLMEALLKQKISFNVAEAIVKLEQHYREVLAELFVEQGKLTMNDVRSAKQVRQKKAMAELPASIFTPEPPPPSYEKLQLDRIAVALGMVKLEEEGLDEWELPADPEPVIADSIAHGVERFMTLCDNDHKRDTARIAALTDGILGIIDQARQEMQSMMGFADPIRKLCLAGSDKAPNELAGRLELAIEAMNKRITDAAQKLIPGVTDAKAAS